MPAVKYYQGSAPAKCDLCANAIDKTFFDAKTRMGPWANLCPTCYVNVGLGQLGTGMGQKYEKQDTGCWAKTGG
jgi:hypothetical protein